MTFEGAGARIEVLSASGVLTATWDDLLAVGRLDKAMWQAVIDLEVEASRAPGCVDMGSSVIAVARKV